MTLLAGCSNDKKSGANNAGASGSAGSGGNAGNGGSAGTGGAAGNGGNGGGGGNTTPAAFQGIWKQQSAEIIIIDPANPGAIRSETVTIPPTIAAPNDGRQVDIYQEIHNDAWVTYAHYAGDSVYFKTRQPLTKAEEAYVAYGEDGTHMYQIEDGNLVDNATVPFGSVQTTSVITFAKHPGAFPPSSWPQQAVELP